MHGAIRFIERRFLQLAIINGVLTLFMMVLICIDIFGRKFFNAPLYGATEVSTLFLVALIFIGMAAAQVHGQHYNVDLLYGAVPRPVQRLFDVVASLVSTAFTGYLAWLTAAGAWKSTLAGEASFAVIAFPVWPARIVVAVGLFCLAVQFFFGLLRNLGLIPELRDADHDDAGGVL